MLGRLFEILLLRPEDMEPSCDDLKVIGMFSSGAVRVGIAIIDSMRVPERPSEMPATLY